MALPVLKAHTQRGDSCAARKIPQLIIDSSLCISLVVVVVVSLCCVANWEEIRLEVAKLENDDGFGSARDLGDGERQLATDDDDGAPLCGFSSTIGAQLEPARQ